MLNDAISIDNQRGWQGQCPGLVSIIFWQINVKFQIHFSQVLRQVEFETIALCHLVARIAEYFKGQILFFSEFSIVCLQLR